MFFFHSFIIYYPNIHQIKVICHILMNYWEFCSQKIKITDFRCRKVVKWPQNVGVLIFFCRLFFLGALDPLVWENHSGIKSPGGGRLRPGGSLTIWGEPPPQKKYYNYILDLPTGHLEVLKTYLWRHAPRRVRGGTKLYFKWGEPPGCWDLSLLSSCWVTPLSWQPTSCIC